MRIKEWFRKKVGNRLDRVLSILQINTKIGQSMDEEINKKLDHLKQKYFASPDNPVITFSPEQTRERLKQTSDYATHLGEDFSKSEPAGFRKKMQDYRYGILSLAEYEYYWIAIEKEAIKRIGSKDIVKELERSLAIRKRIFQMCMANEMTNPLLNEKAFDEVIGRIAYRHYQIDTAILRNEKNSITFASKHETTEKRKTRSGNVRSVVQSAQASQPVTARVTDRLEDKMPKENLEKKYGEDAEKVQEKESFSR